MEIQSRHGKIATGTTIIASNLKKKSVTLDLDGNEIDPKTKRIIRRKDAEK